MTTFYNVKYTVKTERTDKKEAQIRCETVMEVGALKEHIQSEIRALANQVRQFDDGTSMNSTLIENTLDYQHQPMKKYQVMMQVSSEPVQTEVGVLVLAENDLEALANAEAWILNDCDAKDLFDFSYEEPEINCYGVSANSAEIVEDNQKSDSGQEEGLVW